MAAGEALLSVMPVIMNETQEMEPLVSILGIILEENFVVAGGSTPAIFLTIYDSGLGTKSHSGRSGRS